MRSPYFALFAQFINKKKKLVDIRKSRKIFIFILFQFYYLEIIFFLSQSLHFFFLMPIYMLLCWQINLLYMCVCVGMGLIYIEQVVILNLECSSYNQWTSSRFLVIINWNARTFSTIYYIWLYIITVYEHSTITSRSRHLVFVISSCIVSFTMCPHLYSLIVQRNTAGNST